MSRKGTMLRVDWQLVTPVLVLVLLSLTTLFSINFTFFLNQLLFFFIGTIFFLFFSQVDYQVLRLYTIPIYIVSLVILFLLLAIGFESRGALRWFDIFGFRIQFSEILKPFLILALSSFLAEKKDVSLKNFLVVFGLLLPIGFFIFRQPDLGNAIIYSLIAVFMLLLYGFPLLWFVIGLCAFFIAIPFSWHFLHQYQQQRLLSFFNISHDPLGSSYNAIQAVIAVGSGKFFGKGLGQGTQSVLRFLPERHTDFIFATLAEMLGLIGALFVIIAFVFLLYRLFVILQTTDDTFSKVFIGGSFFLTLVQCFMNIGMNIGLLPIVGVTLPFMSYGGSSLIANAILLGLISSISSVLKNKHVLEIT